MANAHSEVVQQTTAAPPHAADVQARPNSAWLAQLWSLSFFAFLSPSSASILDPDALLAPVPEVPVTPPCWVEPLMPIEDPGALAFEQNIGSTGVVRTDGLTPATAQALEHFHRLVAAVGGSVVLTSAYRPAAYQEHLQNVWDKWMRELRENREEDCQQLRAEIEREFNAHQLLESQRPATSSDHTRGISFDASVFLPSRARLKRRRVSLDGLARMAGISRPALRSDPVHFRLIG